ncbi:7SK snRNA methylphosphate capping enzyme isoform X2 [Lepisosteus oculatus]|uniref:7SK snRNA methylphosphate capping enzyme isoform X2 n=1 Tax=Lepisosteus oculatus TaxID=7918 RepID=UPI00371C17A0
MNLPQRVVFVDTFLPVIFMDAANWPILIYLFCLLGFYPALADNRFAGFPTPVLRVLRQDLCTPGACVFKERDGNGGPCAVPPASPRGPAGDDRDVGGQGAGRAGRQRAPGPAPAPRAAGGGVRRRPQQRPPPAGGRRRPSGHGAGGAAGPGLRRRQAQERAPAAAAAAAAAAEGLQAQEQRERGVQAPRLQQEAAARQLGERPRAAHQLPPGGQHLRPPEPQQPAGRGGEPRAERRDAQVLPAARQEPRPGGDPDPQGHHRPAQPELRRRRDRPAGVAHEDGRRGPQAAPAPAPRRRRRRRRRRGGRLHAAGPRRAGPGGRPARGPGRRGGAVLLRARERGPAGPRRGRRARGRPHARAGVPAALRAQHLHQLPRRGGAAHPAAQRGRPLLLRLGPPGLGGAALLPGEAPQAPAHVQQVRLLLGRRRAGPRRGRPQGHPGEGAGGPAASPNLPDPRGRGRRRDGGAGQRRLGLVRPRGRRDAPAAPPAAAAAAAAQVPVRKLQQVLRLPQPWLERGPARQGAAARVVPGQGRAGPGLQHGPPDADPRQELAAGPRHRPGHRRRAGARRAAERPALPVRAGGRGGAAAAQGGGGGAGAGSGSGSGTEAGAGSSTGSGSGSGAGSPARAGAGSGSGAGSPARAGAGSGSGAGSPARAGAGSGSPAGSGAGAGS